MIHHIPPHGSPAEQALSTRPILEACELAFESVNQISVGHLDRDNPLHYAAMNSLRKILRDQLARVEDFFLDHTVNRDNSERVKPPHPLR